MKKHLLIASILGFGMAVAQAQQPRPMQSGAPDPSSRPSANMPANGSGNGGVGATSATGTSTDDTAAPQSFKGCLTGSSGNWTLASDKGQSLKISGTDDQLSSYNNQQVNIQGTQATDGTVKVASIDKIGESCSNNGQASTSGTDQNTSTPSAASGSMADRSATSTTTSNTASSTTTAGNSVTSTTPDQNSAATSTSPSTTTSSNNDQNAGVGASGANSNAGAGQSSTASSQSATSTTSADQNANASQNANAGQNANASNDQNSVRHISDMDKNQNTASSNADQNAGGQKLPQTASPLPLLGLMGLGSLLTGLAARRKK